MTADEIKAEIAAGRIGAITLDTSAFGRPSEMSLEHGLFARLRQFRGTGVQLVLSDVVLNEVEAHMRKGANDALTQLDNSLKVIGGSWNIARDKRIEAKKHLIGEDSPDELSRRRVNSFIESTGCTIIKAEEHATIEELVRRYFSNTAPFADKDTKKNEFPDALALMSINAWAEAEGKDVLVVSNDNDWIRYCNDAPRLIVVRNLTDALNFFNANADVVCRVLSLKLTGAREEWRNEIESAVQLHIESMIFIPEAESQFYLDDEITEVYVTEVSIVEAGNILSPVDMGNGILVAEAEVIAKVEISCEFSFSVKDGIDKDYLPMGSSYQTVTESIELRVLISFEGDIPDDAYIEDIEVEGNRHYVSFGEVEPDWMSDSTE